MPAVRTLRTDVARLALAGGRMVGTEGHQLAEQYVLRRLDELGLAPYSGRSYRLPYRVGGLEFTNLVGLVRGRDSDAAPVLVGAHYDSVIPAPCADDNAAAVAIALAAASTLIRRAPERDVIIAIFDAEEPPYFQTDCMGSTRFYEDQLDERGVHAAVIMDLVGHDVVVPFDMLSANRIAAALGRACPRLRKWDIPFPILRDLLFITGAESHPALPGLLTELRTPRRLRPIAALNRYIGDMSDQGVFRVNGVPYLFLSCGRWPHYHVPTDTPDRLNYRKMHRITTYLTRIVASFCGAAFDKPAEPVDPVAFEIATLERALGPLRPVLLRALGIPRPETREDLDFLAEMLLATGL